MIAFFFRSDGFEHGQLNGQGWLLRAYSKLDNLIPLQSPGHLTHSIWGNLKPYTISYEIGKDSREAPTFCSKIGGVPDYIQGEPEFTADSLFPEDVSMLDSQVLNRLDYFDSKRKDAEPEIPLGDFWKARGWDKIKEQARRSKSLDYTYAFQLDSETFFGKTG